VIQERRFIGRCRPVRCGDLPSVAACAWYLYEADHPSEKFPVEHISIHGHQIGYRRGGQGPVLLLLHGIAGSSLTWVPAMRLLQSDYTVLAPDFLGHGASEKPLGDYSLGNLATVMRDFLNLLGIDRATVVGQSFGGGVAMQFAYQFPERCERLVLVDAGGLGREVNWILRLATLPGAEYVMPALFPAFVGNWGDSVVRFFGGRGFPQRRGGGDVALLQVVDGRREPPRLRPYHAVRDRPGRAVGERRRPPLPDQTHMPTLIVWGDHDRIIPLDHAYLAHEAIPNSRLEVMEGVGHYPHVEEPVRFVEILRDFLRTTEPSKFNPEELLDLLRQGPQDEAALTNTTSADPQL
jgi:pimeloyl-ACP methyl ester carboxylesterase